MNYSFLTIIICVYKDFFVPLQKEKIKSIGYVNF